MSSPLFRRAASARSLCCSQHIRCSSAYAFASTSTASIQGARGLQKNAIAGPSSRVLDVHQYSTQATKDKKCVKRPTGTTRKAPKPVEDDVIESPSAVTLNFLEGDDALSYLIKPRQTPLVLADLERYRPQRQPNPEDQGYAAEYNKLVDTIHRAFTKRQFLMFAEMYGIPLPRNRASIPKFEIAEEIIEKQWGWPTVEEVEKQRRDRTEVTMHSFPLTAPELFHVLGKDGADLLQLSLFFNVYVSVSSNPLALKVEGSRKSVKQLQSRLAILRKGIVSETVDLPSGTSIPRDILQRLSRGADVFIENLDGNGKVKIYSTSTQSLSAAKRFIIRSDFLAQASPSRPLLSFLSCHSSSPDVTVSPRSYALYPFLSLPSTPLDAASSGNFRVRAVGQWLGSDSFDFTTKPDVLDVNVGTTWDIHGNATDLKCALLNSTSEMDTAEGTVRTVTAFIGQLLLSCNTPQRRVTLTPPLQGQLPMSKILSWIAKTHPKRTFLPSVSPSVINTTSNREQSMHRLVFRNTRSHDAQFQEASKLLILELPIPDPGDEPLLSRIWQHGNGLEPSKRDVADDDALRERTSDFHVTQDLLAMRVRLQYGTETSLDLMVPDKPCDVRFRVTNLQNIAVNMWPEELMGYCSALRSYAETKWKGTTRPDAPLFFRYRDDDFVLDSNVNIRQSLGATTWKDRTSSWTATSTPTIVIESTVDLEANRKASYCEVECRDPQSDDDLKALLTVCDSLMDGGHRSRWPQLD